MAHGRTTCLAFLVAALSCARAAHAGKASVEDDAPQISSLRPPGAILEVSAGLAIPRPTLSAAVGVHDLFRDRWLWGIRASTYAPFGSTDYDGDGESDWLVSSGGPHFEAQLDLGAAVWTRRGDFRIVAKGALRRLDDSGREIYQYWYPGIRTRELLLVSGLRVAIAGDAVAAIPLGVRYGGRRIAPKKFRAAYREWWVQARALFVVPNRSLGLDAEVVLPRYAVALFAEYLPALGDADATSQCSPATRECEPPYSPNAFDQVPGSAQLLVGVRLRLTFPFRALSRY